MKNAKKYVSAGVAIAAAAVAAHSMQSGSKPGALQTSSVTNMAPAPAPARQPATEMPLEMPEVASNTVPDNTAIAPALTETASAAAPRPPRDVLMPAPLPNVGADLGNRMSGTDAEIEPIAPQPDRNKFGLTCGPILSASALEGAMVQLTLTAPCRGEERVVVTHGDMQFAEQTDQMGTLQVVIPALAAEAVFNIAFVDGESYDAIADVKMPERLERVALMSNGEAGMQIHALEFGADYGDAGHIWAGNARDADTALAEGGGYMVTLGNAALDDPQMVEIYTFPSAADAVGGVVRLSVEAEVTAYNCEKDVAGKTLELTPEGEVFTVDITVSVPACTAIGEYLVLKNLLRDLKIATN